MAEGAPGVCHGPSAPEQAMLELNRHLPGRHMGKEKSRQNRSHADGVEAEQTALWFWGRRQGEEVS